jgi:hypothetical protein
VQDKTKERWQEICAQAAIEQDGEKLIELTKEIVRLLEEKEARLRASASNQNRTPAEHEPPIPEP